MSATVEFDEIRPYNDDEVVGVVNGLLNDAEFIDTIVRFKLPRLGRVLAPLLRPLVKSRLAKEAAKVKVVYDFQTRIEAYLRHVIDTTVGELTVSGLEHLARDKAHLFVSNHRDIAMDPAFVNWTLYQNGFTTLRIAIGDNLLTKPFASDLMRLNKSFIVNRSATAAREKFKAAKLLSKYIFHSVKHDNENVWIAQREGRAKDGDDKTNAAIISMLALNKDKPTAFADYIRELCIVPVSISYEYDPCGYDKARELTTKALQGEYKKQQHEDVQSIAKGITGYKGNIHLSFGEPLNKNFENSEEVTEYLDKVISQNYVLHATNCFAYEMLEKKSPRVLVGAKAEPFCDLTLDEERARFEVYVNQCPSEYRETLLKGYAKPVYKKLPQ